MREYVCGKNSVFDAIKSNFPIEKIYVQNGLQLPIALTQDSYPMQFVSKEFLNHLTNNQNHQGYAIEIKPYQYFDLDAILTDNPSKILVLDHVLDPQNFGAILRVCNAANVRHVVISKDHQVKMTPAVYKVSSGGYVGIKIIQVVNISNALKELKKHNFWIYGTALEEAMPYSKVSYNYPLAIVVGNEEKGIRPNVLKNVDQTINIPMHGTVQSLNVAIATAIILFNLSI